MIQRMGFAWNSSACWLVGIIYYLEGDGLDSSDVKFKSFDELVQAEVLKSVSEEEQVALVRLFFHT